MNELTIISKSHVDSLKKIDRISYGGFVYAIECGKQLVKIGSTENPYQRIKTLISNLEGYGGRKVNRIAVTICHTNYRNNETIIQNELEDKRKKSTELFKITFDEATEIIKNRLSFFDESEEFGQKHLESFNRLKEWSEKEIRKKEIEEKKIAVLSKELFELIFRLGHKDGRVYAVEQLISLIENPNIDETTKLIIKERINEITKFDSKIAIDILEYAKSIDTTIFSEEEKELYDHYISVLREMAFKN